MKLFKSIVLTIMFLFFCNTMLLSQSKLKSDRYIEVVNGENVLVHKSTLFKDGLMRMKVEEDKEYKTISNLTYEEARATEVKYTNEGWTFMQLEKQKDGKWTIIFSKNKQK